MQLQVLTYKRKVTHDQYEAQDTWIHHIHNSVAVHIQKQDQFVCVCSIQKVNLSTKPKGKERKKIIAQYEVKSYDIIFTLTAAFTEPKNKKHKRKRKKEEVKS